MTDKLVGRVYLVGAGPGDPGLLTLRGAECIRRADVIVYDRLVHPSILCHARPEAELIYVGKESSRHTMKQEDINSLLVEKAREGKTVVRLKGGDPFVFGRGGEEAEALVEAGIEWEEVPGVTSAIAAPAYAGIPVTHRGLTTSLGIITGHERAPSPSEGEGWGEGQQSRIKWDKISTGLDTIVFLMGVENLPSIVSELVANGRDPSTPVALVRWGTRAEQETLVGTLADIVEKSAGFKSPAVTVVGDVVNLREKLRWFDNRPLSGKRVLVTRSRDQASKLSELLREQGAEPVEFPVIRISPVQDCSELDAAIDRIGEYDWILFTSTNAVYNLCRRLYETWKDVRSLKGPKIGAIGPATAEAVSSLGMRMEFIPSEFVAESVVEEFPEDPAGKRILIPGAKDAREVLPEKLRERGAQVDVVASYQTVIEESCAPPIKEMLERGEIDIITFTSSSTVKNFVQLVGRESVREGVMIACIGPITAQTAEDHGLHPDIVAEDYTIEGLVKAITGR
ncbi:MAG: uroporphyrinogen-III C-methyltransferase [Armatimonadetes bacterium]|nr:uroporphyrinogen-III C-methyltransferase [Armatimonadota bacterium]